jgi:hypothetical protein
MRASPSRPILFAAVALLLSLTGCAAKKDLLDPGNLFGDADPATPNKLRGVYQLLSTDGNSNIEIRLRFTDHYVVGAIKCVPINPKFGPLDVGDKVNMGTDDLDAATGKFSVDTLSMTKDEDPIICEGGLVGDTYDFKVEDLRLTLKRPSVVTPVVYSKIGD